MPAGKQGRGPWPAAGRLTFWQCVMLPVEWLFTRLAGSRPVPGSRGVFLVAYHRHRGHAVALPDGTTVRPGDPVAELHFWNAHIAQRRDANAEATTWRLARDVRSDLRALAAAMSRGEVASDAVAVYGASPVARAAERLGFTVLPVTGGWRRIALSAWQLTVRRVFRPATIPADLHAATTEVWLSRQRLMGMYGDSRARSSDHVTMASRHPTP